jgi:putative ABC transport system permease protein
MPSFGEFAHDLRDGFRQFARSPRFTAVVVVTLALGVAINAVVFSLVHAVLIRPLPYAEPDRLVMVWNAYSNREQWRSSTTKETVLAWREGSAGVFSGLAVVKLWDGNRDAWFDVVLSDRAERLRAGLVTSSFFQVLDVMPALGRVFSPADEASGHSNGVVLSDALWRRSFGADPNVIGRSVTFTTGDRKERRPRPYVVIGVLEPSFKFTYDEHTEVWAMQTWAEVQASPQGAISFNGAVARLASGVTLAAAAGRMVDLPHRPENARVEPSYRLSTRLEPMSEWVLGKVRSTVLLLEAAALVLLLVTCATVAGALLVRSAERERDFAIRASLGARRTRLARLAVAEALILSLAGTATGVLLSLSILPLFRALVPALVPRAEEISANFWLVGYGCGVVTLMTVAVAVLPAIQATRVDVVSALRRASGQASSDRRTRALRTGLLVTQAAIVTTLFVGAILLLVSFWRLGRVDLGFDADRVLTVEMRPIEPRYLEPGVLAKLQDEIITRVRAIPGVVSAGITSAVPFRGVDFLMAIHREGTQPFVANRRTVDETFFSILNIPLRRGRLFDASDTPSAPQVAVISESFSHRMFGDADPIGRTFSINQTLTVVGVAGDVRYISHGAASRPAVYLPRSQQPSELMCLVIQTAAGVPQLATALHNAIRVVDPALPAMKLTTIDEIIGNSVSDRRFYTTSTAAFASLALALTAGALVVVIARSVVERRRELAIRAALGAGFGGLVRIVAGHAILASACGIGAGLAVAWYATTVVEQFMFGIDPREPWVFAASGLFALLVASLAALVPGLQIRKLQPAAVLRGD